MRAFWIVLDSAGIGNAPDAEAFGDEGSNTWKTCYDSGKLHIPNMEKLGIYNIDEMNYGDKSLSPIGCYGRLHEKSMGKGYDHRALGDGRYDISETISGISGRIPEGCAG